MSMIDRIKSVGFGLNEPMGKFQRIEFTRRPVEDHDILIEILYAGICHSDIHVARGEWGKWHDSKLIPGHEIVGIVKEVGKEVTKFKVGDIAGIGCMVCSCGECENCKNGLEQYCDDGTVLTYDSADYHHNDEITRGGYSTNYVLHENFAVKISKTAANKLEKIPSLMCAGITTYSPIASADVEGKVCAVAGLGGLGHMAVKYLHSFGAKEVYAFDTVNKGDYAKDLDITFMNANERNFKKCFEKFDFLISTIPFDYNLEDYLSMVKRGGSLAIVGLPEFSANKTNFTVKTLIFEGGNKKIWGSQIGGIAETQECVDYSIKHSIYPDVEIISPDPEEINKAYENVRNGKVRFRYVIDMSKLGKTEKFQNGGNIKPEDSEIKTTQTITIGNKTYKVAVAKTEDEKYTGLSQITSLKEDEGMLFVYDEPQEDLWFTMEDTSIDLDIIFIDEEGIVTSVNTAKAKSDEPIEDIANNAQFVLEVNANSGIKVGDELEDYSDDEVSEDEDLTDEDKETLSKSKMLVLDENGNVQFKLDGGERLFSRIFTKKIIKTAIKAFQTDEDAQYRKVGRMIFTELNAQDERPAEYVQTN